MQDSVLIIAPEAAAHAVADALKSQQVQADVEIAGTRRAGLLSLRSAEWSVVLLEESVGGSDSETADLLYGSARGAVVVESNFAVTGAARAVRQVRAALLRRTQQQASARAAALATLRGELRSVLSSLLLDTQLAVEEAAPAQQGKLRNVLKGVNEMRTRLRP